MEKPRKRLSSRRPGRGTHRRPEESFTLEEADDRVQDVFRNHGFGDYPHDKRRQLVKFYQLLMEEQQHNNFTRLLRLRDVAIKHFIDCLMVPRLFPLTFPLLDVGTGPGFPGIPLRIDQEGGRILLAEGVQKRVEFLKRVREQMELSNLDIIGRNVDEEFVFPVQTAITRAVADTGETLKAVSQCVEVGGQVLLMKGPNVSSELEKAKRAWGEFFYLEKDIAYDLPQTPHKRRLVVFRKIKSPPLPEPSDD